MEKTKELKNKIEGHFKKDIFKTDYFSDDYDLNNILGEYDVYFEKSWDGQDYFSYWVECGKFTSIFSYDTPRDRKEFIFLAVETLKKGLKLKSSLKFNK